MIRSNEGGWKENGPFSRVDLRSGLSELWAYRELALLLAARDVRSRYKQAILGVGWTVLQPALTVVVFTLVFRDLAGISGGDVPYVVFALAGTLVWGFVAGGITAATSSMVANASLLTKVYFPRLLSPIAALLPGFIGLGVGWCALIALMLSLGVAPSAWLILAPAVVVWMVMVAAGPGIFLGALNVRYRDIGAVQAALMQLWLLASPVAYPVGLIPSSWQAVYAINPVVGPVEAFRGICFGSSTSASTLAVSAITGIVILVGGCAYFRRQERQFADVI